MIEDDQAIRTAVQRALRERGHAVATAASGLAGLEHVLHESPHVVLLDLGLPDVDGLALISMIRAASNVPIIVITAQDGDPTWSARSTAVRTTTWSSRSAPSRSLRGSVRCCAGVAGTVERRGACAHPDGTVRLVRSLFTMLPEEVAAHATDGCMHRPERVES